VTVPLLEVRNLAIDRARRRIIDGISFEIRPGETLGIIGRSGSGKSTLARAIARLIPAASGSVLLNGVDLLRLRQPELRGMRGKMQIIFQDPASSLDPRATVEEIVAEPLRVHARIRPADRHTAIAGLLRAVQLPLGLLSRYPHELSGGQAQRVAFARALATAPSLLIADEAFSAVDASLKAEMANLVVDLRQSLGLACIIITHDLRLAAWLCGRIAVLADGRLVESGTPAELCRDPRHPVTRALVAACAPC
jgi:peptide/nickel transport system ATP-binding protein